VKNLAVIVPSRRRPHNIIELLHSFEETQTESDLIVVIDDDDPTKDAYLELGIDKTIILPREGKGMAKPLNKASSMLKDEYRHFSFLGDDHRPRTKNWDVNFIDTLDELGTGIVYGNDLLQGENLPTAVAMTGNIVKALDGMVPTGLIHLYLDNFWMQLGKDLGALRYLGHIIIEHLHPVSGKVGWDEGYRDVNAQEVYTADAKVYFEYIAGEDYQNLLKVLLAQR
jgi:glycosyltransferase involved in cell wall biosynthesis